MRTFVFAALAALMLAGVAPAQADGRYKALPDQLAVAFVICPDGSQPTAHPNHPNNVLPLLQCGDGPLFDHPGIMAMGNGKVCVDGRLPVTQISSITASGQTAGRGMCRDGAALIDAVEMLGTLYDEGLPPEVLRAFLSSYGTLSVLWDFHDMAGIVPLSMEIQ